MTPPELRLWTALRKRPEGFKFRRQHPLGPYMLDFYCDAAKLGVEVDGIAHDLGGNPARDLARDAWLGRQGIGVLRIVAEEVRVNLEGVVAGIVAASSARCPAAGSPLHDASRGPPPPEGAETTSIGRASPDGDRASGRKR
jgi:very-short-patch-repair endonuclease